MSFNITEAIVKGSKKEGIESIAVNLMSVLNCFIGCLGGGKTLDTFDSNPNNLANPNNITNVENTSGYAERVEKIVKVFNDQVNENDIEKAYQHICNALSNE